MKERFRYRMVTFGRKSSIINSVHCLEITKTPVMKELPLLIHKKENIIDTNLTVDDT